MIPASSLSPSAGVPALSMTGRLWALLALLGLLWGGSFFFTQLVVHEIAPLSLVALRVGIAAVALLAFLALRRMPLAPLRQRAGAFLLLGLLNNAIPFLLLAIGQKAMGAGLASILNATTPLWTILVAALATSDERLSGPKLVGIGLGIAGVAVLVGPEAFGAGHLAPLPALAAVLGATFSYALAAVFARRFRGVPPTVVATGQLCGSSLIVIPLALLLGTGPGLGAMTPAGIMSMLALALVSTAFAYILFFEIVARAGATNASLVTFLVPASAILLGILFLGETLSLREVLGFGAILAGLAAIDGRLARGVAKAWGSR
ncbi:DMT family transporter [Aureimonas glaciei]|uniref:ABC transporter permease n=1 Tax=Aureimonas glaciei TaxID=1776957 RepID=A0A917DBC4_9HYPH|nr:DMT family transporter [Aureimonas glaciei]GGD20864.1 ABC transporter permease [Aureimonas glaciei]